MSQFSTGELAKAAEVSVRTVQYYDQRGILTPSEVTEGGRRIYHESDLERLQVIWTSQSNKSRNSCKRRIGNRF